MASKATHRRVLIGVVHITYRRVLISVMHAT